METLMQTLTPASQLIPGLKGQTQHACDHMVHVFSFMPEDKVTWEPVAGVKSALQLIVHCAYGNFQIAKAIRQEPAEAKMDFAEMMIWADQEERKVTSAEHAIQLLKDSTADVIAALDAVTDEALAGTADSAFGEMPMMFWVSLPARHMEGHTYQMDYIQTCLGDKVPHFAGM